MTFHVSNPRYMTLDLGGAHRRLRGDRATDASHGAAEEASPPSRSVSTCAGARTYRVEYKRDLRPESGLHWRLHTTGMGHWGIGGPEAGAFQSATEADAAGRRWVETGRGE